jgi:hypothetical protein
MSTPETIRLSRMRKAGLALLSKRITLGEDGRPLSDGTPCAMTSGTATRVALDWWSPASDLAALILDLGSHEALVLGDHVAQTDTIEITTAAYADPQSGRYGRTLDTFKFRDDEPAPVLLDHDRKDISDSARAQVEELGGFEGAIASLIPSYPTLARVIRASTSAGLRNEETGETFPGNGGQHVYLFARNGADIPPSIGKPKAIGLVPRAALTPPGGEAPVQAYIAAMPGLEKRRRAPPRRAHRAHRSRRAQGGQMEFALLWRRG